MGKKVLVADDDPGMIKILTHILEMEDCEVSSALDGEAALQGVREIQPDVLIIDMNMPKMDGLDVLRKLSGEQGTPVPAILLTAQDPEDLAGVLAGLPHVVHLEKPFELDKLLGVLQRLLG